MFDNDADAALFAAYWIGKRVYGSFISAGNLASGNLNFNEYEGVVVGVEASKFSGKMMLKIHWDHTSAMSGTLYSPTSIKEIPE